MKKRAGLVEQTLVSVETGVASEGARHREVGASPEAAAAVVRQRRRHEREPQLLRCAHTPSD
jgi:hypothetical protein